MTTAVNVISPRPLPWAEPKGIERVMNERGLCLSVQPHISDQAVLLMGLLLPSRP